MPTAVVTGANRGIGLEFIRQYRADGWDTVAICRPSADVEPVVALGSSVERIDITDTAAVRTLADRLPGGGIDLLINNAGINPGSHSLGSIDYEKWQLVFHLNVVAPLQLVESVAPLMSGGAVVASVSSRLGSMQCNVDGGRHLYRAAKAALNAITRSLSVDLRPQGILSVALHPGWVRTDMGGPAADIDVSESVAGMRKVISRLRDDDSGKLINYDGTEIPW